MATTVWWVVAVGAMVGMFAACVILVAVGVRVLENVLARRHRRPSE